MQSMNGLLSSLISGGALEAQPFWPSSTGSRNDAVYGSVCPGAWQAGLLQAVPTVGAGVLGFDPALLRSIAERVGTPAYVYGANLIRAQYHALDDALKDVPHRICYSVKANGNLAVLKVLRGLGAGADIVSLGELRRAVLAGFPPALIVFSGVGKTSLEIQEAIRAGVGSINVESSNELETLIDAAREVGKTARVGIRVNPDVATETHPYTKTGEKTAKFGVPFDEV